MMSGSDASALLPDELWDLVLNGADREGVPMLEPTERPLARYVCRQWREIVENPSRQWIAGHLHCAWASLSHGLGGNRLRRAFVQGRLISALGACQFVRLHLTDPPWHPDALRHACERPPAPEQDHDPYYPHALHYRTLTKGTTATTTAAGADRAVAKRRKQRCALWAVAGHARLDAYLDSLTGGASCNIDRQAWHAVCDYLLGIVGPHDQIASERANVVRWIPLMLVSQGRVHDAVRFFIMRLPHVARSAQLSMAFRLVRATVYHAHDDVDALMAALALVTHAGMPTFDQARQSGDDPESLGRLLWETLATTGSVRCIRALAHLVECRFDTACDPAAVEPAARADGLRPDTQVIADCAALCGMLRESRCAQEPEHYATRPSWLRAAVTLCSARCLLAVIEAHGTRPRDVQRAIYESVRRGDYGTAGLVADRAEDQSWWRDMYRDVPWINCLLLHAGRSRAKVAGWLAQRGYVPDERTIKVVAANARRIAHRSTGEGAPSERDQDDGDVALLAVMADTWPDALCSARHAVRHSIRSAVKHGRWRDARRIVEIMAPLSGHPGLSRRCTDREPDDGGMSLWDAVASGALVVRQNGPGDVPVGAARALALVQLLSCCDPQSTEPSVAAAWRFWVGEPRPVRPNALEESVLFLARRDMFEPLP